MLGMFFRPTVRWTGRVFSLPFSLLTDGRSLSLSLSRVPVLGLFYFLDGTSLYSAVKVMIWILSEPS